MRYHKWHRISLVFLRVLFRLWNIVEHLILDKESCPDNKESAGKVFFLLIKRSKLNTQNFLEHKSIFLNFK